MFDQPCVGIKILLQVGQGPIGKVLIAARTEKEIVRNINRLCWFSALDFAGRSDLFLERETLFFTVASTVRQFFAAKLRNPA